MADEQNGGYIRAKVEGLEKNISEHGVRLNNHAGRLHDLEINMVGLPSKVEEHDRSIRSFYIRTAFWAGAGTVVAFALSNGAAALIREIISKVF